jgi:site-specific DNA-methyltransferase (adenine-specific)
MSVPTQKPLGIIAPLLRYSVPPGGSCVVPFAGSGSECLVALIEGRDALGIELSAENVATAERRISCDAPLFADVQT